MIRYLFFFFLHFLFNSNDNSVTSFVFIGRRSFTVIEKRQTLHLTGFQSRRWIPLQVASSSLSTTQTSVGPSIEGNEAQREPVVIEYDWSKEIEDGLAKKPRKRKHKTRTDSSLTFNGKISKEMEKLNKKLAQMNETYHQLLANHSSEVMEVKRSEEESSVFPLESQNDEISSEIQDEDEDDQKEEQKEEEDDDSFFKELTRRNEKTTSLLSDEEIEAEKMLKSDYTFQDYLKIMKAMNPKKKNPLSKEEKEKLNE
jgi:hypothetical protein